MLYKSCHKIFSLLGNPRLKGIMRNIFLSLAFLCFLGAPVILAVSNSKLTNKILLNFAFRFHLWIQGWIFCKGMEPVWAA